MLSCVACRARETSIGGAEVERERSVIVVEKEKSVGGAVVVEREKSVRAVVVERDKSVGGAVVVERDKSVGGAR